MKKSKRASTVWLAALVTIVALLPAAARAETAAVIVGGPASESDRAIVASAARERIVERRWFVHDADVEPKAVQAAIGCLSTEGSQRCTQGLVPNVDRLLVLSVRYDQHEGIDSTRVAAWLVSSTGELLVANGTVCESCRDSSLRQQMGDLVVKLWLDAIVRSGKTALNIRVQPRLSGTLVKVDGQAVPEGVEYGVFPGMRRIEVSAPGHCPEERAVNARAQEIAPVDIQLRACGSAQRRLWPWLAIGAGAVFAGGGIALLAIDEDAVEGDSRNHEIRDTATYGVDALAVGAVAVGTGVVFLVLGDGPRDERPRPTVARTNSGWSLGLEGRF